MVRRDIEQAHAVTPRRSGRRRHKGFRGLRYVGLHFDDSTLTACITAAIVEP